MRNGRSECPGGRSLSSTKLLVARGVLSDHGVFSDSVMFLLAKRSGAAGRCHDNPTTRGVLIRQGVLLSFVLFWYPAPGRLCCWGRFDSSRSVLNMGGVLSDRYGTFWANDGNNCNWCFSGQHGCTYAAIAMKYHDTNNFWLPIKLKALAFVQSRGDFPRWKKRQVIEQHMLTFDSAVTVEAIGSQQQRYQWKVNTRRESDELTHRLQSSLPRTFK